MKQGASLARALKSFHILRCYKFGQYRSKTDQIGAAAEAFNSTTFHPTVEGKADLAVFAPFPPPSYSTRRRSSANMESFINSLWHTGGFETDNSPTTPWSYKRNSLPYSINTLLSHSELLNQ